MSLAGRKTHLNGGSGGGLGLLLLLVGRLFLAGRLRLRLGLRGGGLLGLLVLLAGLLSVGLASLLMVCKDISVKNYKKRTKSREEQAVKRSVKRFQDKTTDWLNWTDLSHLDGVSRDRLLGGLDLLGGLGGLGI